jgi:hypothetical protein
MNMDNNDDVRFAVVSTLRRIFDETNSLKFLYLAEDSDIDETTDAGILKDGKLEMLGGNDGEEDTEA